MFFGFIFNCSIKFPAKGSVLRAMSNLKPMDAKKDIVDIGYTKDKQIS